MDKSKQIEKMNLEVKENLKLTDEEYEKSKEVLSRLNEMDLEDNPKLIEKENKEPQKQTENQKKIKELEERRKEAEEEEKILIENFSQEIGQSVKDTEKIWGYLKRYALIGMVTGVPGIALTCLYDKWKENTMAKELKELNQKVIASQNEPELHKELAEKYQKYERQFCKVHHIDELQKNIRKSGYISQIKTSKEALLGLVDEINKYKELDKKETEKEFEKLKQLSDEFIKQEESNEVIEEEVEEDEEIVLEQK
ncbi:MAG: hypothetical protein J6M60_00080 [Clostridia bacterium]|nr:hypothetical protein [Clostridia bacterium]